MRILLIRTLLFIISIITFISLFGCADSGSNFPPILVDVLKDMSVIKNGNVTVTMLHVSGYDEDGDELSLVVSEGESYTLVGATIFPDSEFVGDLFIPIQLSDSRLLSNIDTMIISVVSEIVVQPDYDGSWWQYDDSVPTDDTVLSSRLILSDTSMNVTIDSTTTVLAKKLYWSNLSEYGINYLVGNDSLGQYQYGVQTPYDTLIKSQLQHMYPCTLNSSWPFTLIKYNVTDNLLFEDTTVTMTCTDTAVYVKVPAGTFKCIEYSFLYDLPEQRSFKNDIIITPLSTRAMGDEGTITEKIYYSEGVGYVQNITLNGNSVIWKKVLTDYYVEEIKE